MPLIHLPTLSCRYRRGKQESNDVDIVISHPSLRSEKDQVKGLCAKLVQRLYERGTLLHSTLGAPFLVDEHICAGLVTHVMREHASLAH